MREFEKIRAVPIDPQIISLCKYCPNSVQPDIALGQFRYCIENHKTNTSEYRALRDYLCNMITENSVKRLEVLYD